VECAPDEHVCVGGVHACGHGVGVRVRVRVYVCGVACGVAVKRVGVGRSVWRRASP
jgi:hypothetical protein